jgi:peptidoglycan/LPS O-acetylase OafA/YrhL
MIEMHERPPTNVSQPLLTYQPALDGVRAVSVILVLLFHGGFSWMSGGYLGVSVFFTLSGFLITSLLLAEHSGTGRVGLSHFYARRAKRLLPASVVCVALVCLLAAAGAFDGVDGLRSDAFGALGQVFNWVKLAGDDSYADIAANAAGLRKPLEHYWSLAIEEQFYWLWPLTFIGLTRLARRGWSLTTSLTAMFVVAALAAPAIAGVWGADAAYWATPARISEILAGAVVAAALQHRTLGIWSRSLAPICLLLVVVLSVVIPAGRGPAYQGMLPVFSLISAGLIVGLQHPGPVRQALSVAPMVAVGKVSYGVYLYHWPVFVLVDRQNWDVPEPLLFTAKTAITAAIAAVSYVLIEMPLRRATWLPPRRTLIGALAGVAAAAAIVPLVPTVRPFYAVDAENAAEAEIDAAPVEPLPTLVTTTSPSPPPAPADESSPIAAPVTTAPPTVPPIPPRPVRILMVGDSTAEATGAGLIEWAAANPSLAQVSLEVAAGCPLTPGGWVVDTDERDIRETCSPWSTEQIPARVAELRPDVVVFMTSAWDVTARRLDADGPVLTPTDAVYGDAIAGAFTRLSDESFAAGASRVVWIRQPIPDPWWLDRPLPGRDPARHEVLYSIMDGLAAANPSIRVADLVGEMDARGWLTDQSFRPDGSHFDIDSSTQVASEWLGPYLVNAALT